MYDKIAHYYDLTHNSLTADIGYLLTLTHQHQGAILELGCGTGRLMMPLLKAGHQVVGVDNSPEMLALAQTKLQTLPANFQAQGELHLGDMCQLNPSEWSTPKFSLIIIPYNTFLHFDDEQAEQILRGVRGLLAENGRFFIDLINPHDIAQTPEDHTLTLEAVLHDADETVLQFASNSLHELTQTLDITWVYDATPKMGGAIHRTIAQATYHYRYPHQIEMLLKNCGFKLEKLMGDYVEAPFSEDSDRLLVVASKRH